MTDKVFDALDSDPDHTPTEPPKSDLQLLAEDIRELKVMCTRVDDRSMQMLEAQEQQRLMNEQFSRRLNVVELKNVVGPYILATLALLFAGLSLVK